VRGEVLVRPETDFPDRFARVREVFLVRDDRVETIETNGQRPHRGGVLLRLRGVETLDAAERLRGAAIAVARDALVPLGTDEFYIFDILGLTVRADDGRVLGTVTEVMRAPAHDVYVVRGDAGEVLVPALRTVVRRVDRTAGEMIVALPPGLEATHAR
jgi:16S rRNA processing protein RimM